MRGLTQEVCGYVHYHNTRIVYALEMHSIQILCIMHGILGITYYFCQNIDMYNKGAVYCPTMQYAQQCDGLKLYFFIASLTYY